MIPPTQSPASPSSPSPSRAVSVQLFRWAGQWGPFKVKIPCGECALTVDILEDTFAHELKGIPIELHSHEWLSQWWKPLRKGGWHAPIVLVDGKLVSQGHALNRGVLTEAIITAHMKSATMSGNHVFGKATCPHCVRAKGYLEDAGIGYDYHDVVSSPRALYEMIGRVKPIIGAKTPITVPQIWINGAYVGGASELEKIVLCAVEPNTDRGRCSMSPGGQSSAAA